jgi:putative transposase
MKQVIADLRRIYHAISSEEARTLKDEFVARYHDNPKIQKAIEVLEDGFNDSIQYLNEPESFQKQLTSTNALERLNQEIRRREQVNRIFPNTQSAFRLIGAILMEN